jgi:hypothetical protein
MIFLIGPNSEHNDLNISTIQTQDRRDVFTFVETDDEGRIKPLIIDGVIPKFSSEKKAIEWILK